MIEKSLSVWDLNVILILKRFRGGQSRDIFREGQLKKHPVWHLQNWEQFRILWLANTCICRVNSLNILKLSRHTINLSAFSFNNKILSQPTGLYPVLRRLWSWSWREEPTLTQSLVCRTRFDTKSGQVFFHCTLPCRHMCSRQALVCTASCSVLSISKTARTVTTNFRFWSTIRNQSGA